MDRRERITRFITPQQKGIEIGPYFVPLAPKRLGYNCLALDVFDRATLRRRAAEAELADEVIANIEEVDLLGSSGEIAELVAEQRGLHSFDYVISSHNFEHLPDPIRFLQGCGKVLRPGGILSMAIPDRRTCFDYFRPHSTLADLLDAHLAQRDRPTLAQWFEQSSLHSRYGEQRTLGFSLHDDPSQIIPVDSLAEAFAKWQELLHHSNEEYIDAHCWTFTPASFELLLIDLIFLELISWDILEISDTSGNEFYVHLRNRREPADGLSAAEFYSRRRELLHRANDEMGENSMREYQRQQQLNEARAQAARAEAALDAVHHSMSWRLTAPLRAISGRLPRRRDSLRR